MDKEEIKEEIANIVKQWQKWKDNMTEDDMYDCIHDFVDGELSRGSLLALMLYVEGKNKNTRYATNRKTRQDE